MLHLLAALGSAAILIGAAVAVHFAVRSHWTEIVAALRGKWRP